MSALDNLITASLMANIMNKQACAEINKAGMELETLRSENARLQKAVEEARNVINSAAHELGIPIPGYIVPISNAANILWDWIDANPKEEK